MGSVDVGEALAGSIDVGEALAGSVDGRRHGQHRRQERARSISGPLLLVDQLLLVDRDFEGDIGGDHGDCDSSGPPGVWIQFKEKTVTALMLPKNHKLCEATVGAKGQSH